MDEHKEHSQNNNNTNNNQTSNEGSHQQSDNKKPQGSHKPRNRKSKNPSDKQQQPSERGSKSGQHQQYVPKNAAAAVPAQPQANSISQGLQDTTPNNTISNLNNNNNNNEPTIPKKHSGNRQRRNGPQQATRNEASGSTSLASSEGGDSLDRPANKRRNPRKNPAQQPKQQQSSSSNVPQESAQNSQPSATRTQNRFRKRQGNSFAEGQIRSSVDSTDSRPQDNHSQKRNPPNKGNQKGAANSNKDETKSGAKPQRIMPISQIQLKAPTALSENIVNRLNNDSYECMICTDTIKRTTAIWHCTTCYSLFHLYCIKKWVDNSASHSQQLGAAQPKSAPVMTWRCPGCQTVATSRPVPTCFCGKVRDPKFDPYILPHSCGNTCGKMRSTTTTTSSSTSNSINNNTSTTTTTTTTTLQCPHPCAEVCHPGPCPKCSSLGEMGTCWCGAVPIRLRCGEIPGKSCGGICGKRRNCGLHVCDEVCHEGPCAPCGVDVRMKCYCRKREEVRKCGTGQLDTSEGEARYWSCGQPCGNLLECDNHTCEKTCHPGGIDACGECQLLPGVVKTCPCGKLPLSLVGKETSSSQPAQRKSCLDPIPTCPNVCGKRLDNCAHTCQSLCHTGPCPPCDRPVVANCDCGSKKINCKCSEFSQAQKNQDAKSEFLKAKNIVCNVVCKTWKNCGKHKCLNTCCKSARGGVDPQDTDGLHICSQICNRTLSCGKHKCQLLCHPGKCPACHITIYEDYVCECGRTRLEAPFFCSTKIPECGFCCTRKKPCGHIDDHKCHSRDAACPPCAFLVEKWCMGRHEFRKYIPCYLEEVGCGRECGKQLFCGLHTCKKPCHSGLCVIPETDETDPTGTKTGQSESTALDPKAEEPELRLVCPQKCGQIRKCGHPCTAPCHGHTPCPPTVCTHTLTIFCNCKSRSAQSECLKTGEDSDQTRTLECNDECEKLERNRRFAEALGISPRQQTYYRYSDFLLRYAKASPQLVVRVERIFANLLSQAETSHSFQPMSQEGRRFVHELAENYHLHSVSYDPEPRRHVVVSHTAASKAPPVLLSIAVNQPLPPVFTQMQQMSAAKSSTAKNNNSNSITNAFPSKSESTATSKPLPQAVHLFGLGPEVKSDHINELLKDFDSFHLKWIDEFNCLVCFKSVNMATRALVFIQKNSVFHAQPYNGIPPIPEKEKDDSSDSETAPPESAPVAPSEQARDAPQEEESKSQMATGPSLEEDNTDSADFVEVKQSSKAIKPTELLTTQVPTWAEQMRSPQNNRFSPLANDQSLEGNQQSQPNLAEASSLTQPSPQAASGAPETTEAPQTATNTSPPEPESNNLLDQSYENWEDIGE